MKITNYLFNLMSYIDFLFELFCDKVRLNMAIRLADAKQKAYNKRYFVIPDAYNRLQVFNSDELKKLRKPQKRTVIENGTKRTVKVFLMNPNATYLDWSRDSIYHTNLKDNESNSKLSLEERGKRKKKWLAFMESYRRRNLKSKYKVNAVTKI